MHDGVLSAACTTSFRLWITLITDTCNDEVRHKRAGHDSRTKRYGRMRAFFSQPGTPCPAHDYASGKVSAPLDQQIQPAPCDTLLSKMTESDYV